MCKNQLLISRVGITLIEVLASIFVISIGLLGVLAVIPYGAFQVSKAQHASFTANMLANAAEEVVLREMAKPEKWGITSLKSAGDDILEIKSPTDDSTLNCTKIFWIEPYPMEDPAEHIYRLGATFEVAGDTTKWKEWMRGQDDFEYITTDGDRPERKDPNGKSTGQYTWFFTYKPKQTGSADPNTAVTLANLEPMVTVDLLGCYRRIPGDDKQVSGCTFEQSYGGSRIKYTDASLTERFTQTKYLFVTWEKTGEGVDGAWCKIVFLDKDNKQVFVTGSLPDDLASHTPQVYIANGILYHKQVEGVSIK